MRKVLKEQAQRKQSVLKLQTITREMLDERTLMSFDANGDHRISRDELPDRMQELIARGDRDADAALDSTEIRALVNARSSARPR